MHKLSWYPRSILCVPYCCRTNHKQLENWLQMKLIWLKWKQTKKFCELTNSVFSNILHHILKTILNIDIFHFVLLKNPLVMWKKLQMYSPNYHVLFQIVWFIFINFANWVSNLSLAFVAIPVGYLQKCSSRK